MDTAARISTILRQHKVYSKALLDELVEAISGNKNVFELYEQEIGMLTPMSREIVGDAIDEYPEEWIKSAIEAAAKANVRRWNYVEAILKGWKRDGFQARRNWTKPKQDMTLEEEQERSHQKWMRQIEKYGIEH